MADQTKTLQVKLEATDNTSAAFQSLGRNVENTSKGAKSLTDELKTLGMVGAALFAANALKGFFEDSIKLAYDDEKATIQLEAAIKHLGGSMEVAGPQVKAFEHSMLQIGVTAGDTDKALVTLMKTSGSLSESISMTKLAADLAASGMGDLQGNTDALASLYTGKFRAAAARFGIDMRENTTAAEVYAEILKRVTITAEDATNAQEVKMDELRGKWQEFKGYLGGWALWYAGTFSDIMIKTGKLFVDAAHGDLVKGINEFGAASDNLQEHNDQLTKNIISSSKQREDALIKAHLNEIQAGLDAESAQTAYSDSLKTSFREVSKAVVSALNEQQKAIDDLSGSLDEIDAKLTDDLAKSNEKYQADATNMARSAKERMETIDKQIADEQASRGQGFRTRIEELQKEKAKEQAIIDKAGGVVGNLNSELAKDDLDILNEKHAQELADITSQAQKKKDLAQAEIDARKKNVSDISGAVGSSDFYSRASKEGTTFAGTIGAGGMQQILNFTFNGNVSGDKAIQDMVDKVTASLNRTATLHQIAGK